MTTHHVVLSALAGALLALFASHAAQPLTDAAMTHAPAPSPVLLVTAPDSHHADLAAELQAMGALVETPNAVAQRSLDGVYRSATTDRALRLPHDAVVSVPATAVPTMDLAGQTVVLASASSPRARAEAASLSASLGAASVLHLMTAGALFGALGLLLHRRRMWAWTGLSVAAVEAIALLNGTVLPIEVPLVVLVATGAVGVAFMRRTAADPASDEAAVWARLTRPDVQPDLSPARVRVDD